MTKQIQHTQQSSRTVAKREWDTPELTDLTQLAHLTKSGITADTREITIGYAYYYPFTS